VKGIITRRFVWRSEFPCEWVKVMPSYGGLLQQVHKNLS
jgi:hypothetical protein